MYTFCYENIGRANAPLNAPLKLLAPDSCCIVVVKRPR